MFPLGLACRKLISSLAPPTIEPRAQQQDKASTPQPSEGMRSLPVPLSGWIIRNEGLIPSTPMAISPSCHSGPPQQGRRWASKPQTQQRCTLASLGASRERTGGGGGRLQGRHALLNNGRFGMAAALAGTMKGIIAKAVSTLPVPGQPESKPKSYCLPFHVSLSPAGPPSTRDPSPPADHIGLHPSWTDS